MLGINVIHHLVCMVSVTMIWTNITAHAQRVMLDTIVTSVRKLWINQCEVTSESMVTHYIYSLYTICTNLYLYDQ